MFKTHTETVSQLIPPLKQHHAALGIVNASCHHDALNEPQNNCESGLSKSFLPTTYHKLQTHCH